MTELTLQDPDDEVESVICEECLGTCHDKWGEVCKYCGGEGVIYDDI